MYLVKRASELYKLAAPRWQREMQKKVQNRDVRGAEHMIYRMGQNTNPYRRRQVPGERIEPLDHLRKAIQHGRTGEMMKNEGLVNASKRAFRNVNRGAESRVPEHPYRLGTPSTKEDISKRLGVLKQRSGYRQKYPEEAYRDSKPWMEHPENAGLVKPDDLIPIEHGGSREMISDFIAGRNKGYTLGDMPGNGIFVHPKGRGGMSQGELDRRTPGYAFRGTSSRGGSPAKLTGSIPAKHLSYAPNSSEAALTPENIKHIQNAKVEGFPKEVLDRVFYKSHDADVNALTAPFTRKGIQYD